MSDLTATEFSRLYADKTRYENDKLTKNICLPFRGEQEQITSVDCGEVEVCE